MPNSKLDEERQQKPPETDIKTLSQESDVVIYQTKGVFPFALFPRKVIVTPTRVTIIVPNLLTKDEYPVPIDFIAGARVYRSVFFASLMLETFRYDTPPPVNFLTYRGAVNARKYILALVDCWRNNVDITKYSPDELRQKLLSIGKVERVR